MYTPENSYNYQPPQPYYPQPDPEVIKFQEEKRKMKNHMNTIGIMILIASVVFFVFSLILSFIYYAFTLSGYSVSTNLRRAARERCTFSVSIQYAIRK